MKPLQSKDSSPSEVVIELPGEESQAAAESSQRKTLGEGITAKMVRDLAFVVQQCQLTELVWERGSDRLTIRRELDGSSQPIVVPSAPPVFASPPIIQPVIPRAPEPPPPPAPAAATADEADIHLITSPFVGTFYRASGPDSAPFVEIGQKVNRSQTLCIVEAMKLMNEIESDVAGTVTAILLENGQPVEYGTPLFKIRKG